MSTPSPVRELLRKELLQVGRNRGAMLSATLLPLVILVLAPLPQLFGLREITEEMPEAFASIPGLVDLSDPAALFTQLLYPIFVTIAGLMLPSLSASYTVVSERERKTVDLLLALPVRVADILVAKLLANIMLSLAIAVPLLAISVTVMMITGVLGAVTAVQYLVLLFASLSASTCVSLVLTLIARDFRTANNLNGVLFIPFLLLTLFSLAVIGGPLKLLVLSVLLLLAGGIALFAALRFLTLERYVE